MILEVLTPDNFENFSKVLKLQEHSTTFYDLLFEKFCHLPNRLAVSTAIHLFGRQDFQGR